MEITTLEVQKKNKERVNIYLDGEYAFSLSLIEAAKLHKGQVLSDSEIDVLRQKDTINNAIDSAARFLAYRPRSIQEVRHNLAKKSLSESVIESAIERLEAMGYLDDMAFARYWVTNRDTFKPRGPIAIRFELREKGVSNNIIDLVLENIDTDDAAYRAAQKKVRSLSRFDRQTFRRKLISFLQRRGFSYQTCRDTAIRLEIELIEDDPDFFTES